MSDAVMLTLSVRQHLGGTNVNTAKLWKANLTGVHLGGASLVGADLAGAILAGATLVSAFPTGAEVTAPGSEDQE
jgi:uncharacterized protein YjbI with pentapeptide repeats